MGEEKDCPSRREPVRLGLSCGPPRVLPGQADDELFEGGLGGRAPARLRWALQSRLVAMSLRCQANRVAGVTGRPLAVSRPKSRAGTDSSFRVMASPMSPIRADATEASLSAISSI